MERSLFTLVGNGILGAAAFGMAALGLFWPGPGDPPPGKPEGGWRLLESITYENLTVFPVVSSSGYDTHEFLTLEEGLSRGDVVVREQGADTMVRDRDGVRPAVRNYGGPSVNQLVLVNRSKQPLILLAGELVSGGKQDRVIAKDRIVAPGAEPLPLDVFCVEHGRWSQGANFTAAKTIVHPSVREQAAMKQSQSDVWASVTAGSTAAAPAGVAAPAPRVAQRDLSIAMELEAPTQSYAKLYESSRVAPSVDAMVNEVQRRFRKETSGLKGERVVGVVVAYGGEVAWSDIFASADLFEQYWGKLLRSYAVEAVARPTLREVAAKDDAQEFLGRLNGREKTESEPGVYRWREISEGKLSQIELDALEPKVMTLHRLMVRRTS
jgi:ARG and Rhodanese-Phosphatase-superfamily-associated Protein domain